MYQKYLILIYNCLRATHFNIAISLSINSSIAPSSLSGCLTNEVLNIEYFIVYSRQQANDNEEDNGNTVLSVRLNRKRKMEIAELKRNRSRSVKKHKLFVRNDDGTLREFTSNDTL